MKQRKKGARVADTVVSEEEAAHVMLLQSLQMLLVEVLVMVVTRVMLHHQMVLDLMVRRMLMVLLLLGMLAGIPLWEALESEDGARAAHSWSVIHDTFLLFGVMLLALGAVWQRLVLGARAGAVLLWSLVVSVYVSVVVMVGAAVTGASGLGSEGLLATSFFVGLMVALVGFLLAAALMIRGAYAAWRGTP